MDQTACAGNVARPSAKTGGHALTDHSCPQADRKWVLVAAILASAVAFIDGSVVAVAIPAIRAGIGADFGQAQWIMNGYVLLLAALILPGGALGDRVGQRDVFAVGILAFTATSVWCGLAQSPEGLIAARLAKGAAGALMVPGSLALIARNYPKAERGRAIGLWSAAAGLTTAAGPLVGGAVLAAGGEAAWRWVFLLNVPVGIAALGLVMLRVPRDPGREGQGIDWQGGAVAAAALGLVAYALTRWSQGQGDAVAVAAGLAGLALLGSFVLYERQRDDPMMPPELFASRVFSGANLLTLLLYLGLGGILFYLPTTLIEARGLSEALVGAVFVPMTLIMASMARPVGGFVDRHGPRWPLTIGPVVAAAAFLALALTAPSGGFWTAILPAMALLGLGMGLSAPPLSTAVMGAAPDERAGAASGVNNAVSRVSQLLAVAGLGVLAGLAYRAAIPADVSGLDGVGFGERGEGLSEAAEAARRAAIGAGFRALGLAAAGLALLAALVGWLTQEGAPTREGADATDPANARSA